MTTKKQRRNKKKVDNRPDLDFTNMAVGQEPEPIDLTKMPKNKFEFLRAINEVERTRFLVGYRRGTEDQVNQVKVNRAERIAEVKISIAESLVKAMIVLTSQATISPSDKDNLRKYAYHANVALGIQKPVGTN